MYLLCKCSAIAYYDFHRIEQLFLIKYFSLFMFCRLIDWFMVSPICVSLSMSPTGEYLATSHAGNVGVYLWANSTLYSNVSICPLPDTYNPLAVELPVVTLDGRDSK